MSKVKLGFRDLSIPAMIERARRIDDMMTANANYPTPVPTLIAWKAKYEAAEAAYNDSRGRDKDKLAVLRLRVLELLFMAAQLGAYVQEASGGSEEVIITSGFDVVAPRSPRGPVGQILDLRMRPGSNTGRLKAIWKKEPVADLYVIEYTTTVTDPDSWVEAGTSTKRSFEITGLTPVTKYYVRVYGINRLGNGPVSDPAIKVCE